MLKKILKDNNIKYHSIYNLINCSLGMFNFKISLKVDFTIKELQQIKNYLIDLDIIDNTFDIGCFLDLI